MNERTKQLEIDANLYADEFWERKSPMWHQFYTEKFTELLVKEHLDLLKQEWYNLNNLPNDANELPRDIGLRVGKKSEIVVLIEKIKKHFGVKE